MVSGCRVVVNFPSVVILNSRLGAVGVILGLRHDAIWDRFFERRIWNHKTKCKRHGRAHPMAILTTNMRTRTTNEMLWSVLMKMTNQNTGFILSNADDLQRRYQVNIILQGLAYVCCACNVDEA